MLRTESRSEPRITARLIVESVGPTLNLSVGGMCVLMANQFKTGVEVSLQFKLPGIEQSIHCKSCVVWAKRSDIDRDLYEVGLSFVDISDADRQVIEQFIDSRAGVEE